MKTLNQTLFAIAAIAAMPTMILAQAAPALECQAVTINTKAVALPSARVLNPVVDFSGSGGQLDPTPLLQTDIDVAPSILARGGCLVVHFSTQADPQDNAIIFQVSLDNVPMTGHGAILFSTPVVADPEETDKNLSRMLSYTFFAPLTAGKHTIRVRIASCCTSNPTGGLVVRAATLVAQY